MENKPRFGIYAGSFNPFHLGHLNVVEQAQKIFWRVLVARGLNPDKEESNLAPLPLDFFDSKDIYSDTYSTLLTDYIQSIEEKFGWDITLIRGLRNADDLGYEGNLVTTLKEMLPSVKVVFFICDPHYRHISSSLLRGIRKFSEQEYERYLVKDI
jgi:pantetheine-phosphate adenylyltransferase